MGLFDIFTGKPAQEAAAASRNYYSGVQNTGNANIDTGLSGATNAVSGGAAGARGDLGFGFNNATGAVNSGADAARGAYDSLSALGSKYGGASTMALNALGVNGQGGQDAARSAFSAGPAYNFNLDQGLEAINRRRNMGGMLNSGNADRDAQTFGAGLASNEYDKWFNGLNSFTNPELAATGSAASGVAGVESARGGMLADLSKWYGGGMAGIDTGEGNTLANLQTGAAGQKVGLASSLAPAYGKTYGDAAAAQTAGSGAIWSLGLGAANLGLRAGGVGGFGAPTVANMGTAPAGFQSGGNAPSYPNPYGGSWYG